MLKGRILNSEAIVNNFIEIGALEFIAGDDLTLVIRLFDDQIGLRFIPVSTAITTLVFNKSDGTTLSIVGTPESDDRSIIKFQITAAQTINLLGGNVKIVQDVLGDGTLIKNGIILNALARIILDEGC